MGSHRASGPILICRDRGVNTKVGSRAAVALRQQFSESFKNLYYPPLRVHNVMAPSGPSEAGIMNPRRSATVAAAFYPAVVIAGWAFVSLAGNGSPHIATSAAAHVVE